MSERLHKLLASAGFGSRREIERWIEEGRVSVNGAIAKLGDSASAEDDISIDGRRLPSRQVVAPPRRVIAYYKPEGEITTRNDPEGRPTIFENLPRITQGRWITVGRLDINTSGLLLLTTDGELANRLMHPSHAVQREYAARVLGEVDAEVLKTLLRGVELDDGPARFESIVDAGGPGANHWYHVTLSEGRNREVRRLWETQGVKVSRLIRVRYGPLTLPRRLRPGRWQDLTPEELAQLLELVGLQAEQTPVVATGKAPQRNTPRTRGKMPARSNAATRTAKAPGEAAASPGKSRYRNVDAVLDKPLRRGAGARPDKSKASAAVAEHGRPSQRANTASRNAKLQREIDAVAGKPPVRGAVAKAGRNQAAAARKPAQHASSAAPVRSPRRGTSDTAGNTDPRTCSPSTARAPRGTRRK